MKVIKAKGEHGLNIVFQEGEKYLAFIFEGNVDDIGHQIHIEECLYQQAKTKMLKNF